MIAGGLVAEAAAALLAAGIEAPRREAWLLLAHLLGDDANALALTPDRAVSPDQATAFRALVKRRATREPFAYLTGRRGFWSLDLEVTADTLIPRPETECLVEAVLAFAGSRSAPLEVLDLGTGTGAILFALLSEWPNANGFGVDVSLPALAVAGRNAMRAGVGDRARFGRSSWWSHVTGVFDIVVANPPYIPSRDIAALEPEVARYEPSLALDGGPDGLAAYRAIAAGIDAHLSPGGALFIEIGVGQQDEVARLFTGVGLAEIQITPDLAGVPRVVAAARPASVRRKPWSSPARILLDAPRKPANLLDRGRLFASTHPAQSRFESGAEMEVTGQQTLSTAERVTAAAASRAFKALGRACRRIR